MGFISNLKNRSAVCHRYDDHSAFVKVQSNLALTPAQIQRATNLGLPVSTASLSPDVFFDGYDGTGDIPLSVDMMRGVDIVDTWNASRDAKLKFLQSHKQDVQRFG